jgi:phospholipid/cholesterol/gamma-HCH transport system substrate-binding protein
MADKRPGLKFLAFSVVCVLAAAYVISVTGNYHRIPFITQTSDYQAVLSDVSGLFPGDDVRLSGVPVGRVDEIAVDKGNAVVTFRIKPEIKVLDTWEVGVRWRNIIGGRHLYLYPVGNGARLEAGSRIPVERSRGVADIGRFLSELTPLLQAIDPQAQNQLLTELNKALVGRADEISELTSDLGRFGNTVADQEAAIARVLRNSNTFLAEFNERDEQLTGVIDDLASVGGVLRERNDEVFGAITDIAEVQKQFGDLLEANDEEMGDILDNLAVTMETIGDNRKGVDKLLGSLPDGAATYMLISRWGQWFNTRGVAVQVQRNGEILFCRTEGNGPCGLPNDWPESQEKNARTTPPSVSEPPKRRSAVGAIAGMTVSGSAAGGVRP